jgi:hypothetical protein
MDDRIGGAGHVLHERAEYIERMSQELSRLATGAGMPMLAFILDMASEEAALIRNAKSVSLAPDGGKGTAPRPLLTHGR